MNQKEYKDIIRAHKDAIYRICLGYIYEANLVDDLFQEVLIALWKSLPSFQGKSLLSTFIYRVTVNTAISFNRKQQKHQHTGAIESGSLIKDSALDQITQKEDLNLLRLCIQKLEEQDRLIISLYLEELKFQEIADIAGITENYVGVKISRIKEQLKKCMQDHE